MLDEAKLNKELAYHFLIFSLDKDVSSRSTPKSSPKVPKVSKDIVEQKNFRYC